VDDSAELLAAWNRARPRFDDPSVRPSQKAWIGLTRPLALIEDTALLAAPNDYAKDYLENRLRPLITSVLSDELGRDVQIAVTVQTTEQGVADDLAADGAAPDGAPLDGLSTDEDDLEFDAQRPLPGFGPSYRPKHLEDDRDREARLNPKYTFDTFVIGASNRFTHAAAVAVAEAPARAYNPFFIYGESGLGKTHLLHAIGHYAQRLQPGLRTRYVSSEEFTNDFINSVRDDKMQAFQTRYRSVDLLLIDDIQFIERAERTQDEFFHTFNTLHNQNKQIVISSDKPPRQLSLLEDRLRTRFEWGLISDVQAPDLETRIAILRKKAAQEGMNPPPEVLEYIASKIQSNIRELEGALIRVTAFASVNRQALELGLAEMVLKDLVGEANALEINAPTIMAVAAEYFSVSLDDLVGGSRSRVLVAARQMAMYLCRELTDLSLPKIGEQFGGRDHTTVMHADRKIRAQMGEKLTVYNQISELTNRIKARSRA
jgi:chromosomal replication initiator protein